MKSTFESRGLGGRDSLVEEIKDLAAKLEDSYLKVIPNNESLGHEAPRAIAVARTKLEESVMWAVKGISRR